MEQILVHPFFLTAVVLWTLPWKGVALWRAAKRGEMKWFIVLLVVNTLGVLEIIYIFFFSKKSSRPNET